MLNKHSLLLAFLCLSISVIFIVGKFGFLDSSPKKLTEQFGYLNGVVLYLTKTFFFMCIAPYFIAVVTRLIMTRQRNKTQTNIPCKK